MSNLRLINETTVASGSAVSFIQINDVFSSDFDIYKITTDLNQVSGSASTVSLRLVNASGSVITASNYDYANLRMFFASAFSELRGTNSSRALEVFGATYGAEPEQNNVVTYIFNPYSSSSYTFTISQVVTETNRSTKGIAVLKQTASMTGFGLYSEGSTSQYGTIRTYGLRVDS